MTELKIKLIILLFLAVSGVHLFTIGVFVSGDVQSAVQESDQVRALFPDGYKPGGGDYSNLYGVYEEVKHVNLELSGGQASNLFGVSQKLTYDHTNSRYYPVSLQARVAWLLLKELGTIIAGAIVSWGLLVGTFTHVLLMAVTLMFLRILLSAFKKGRYIKIVTSKYKDRYGVVIVRKRKYLSIKPYLSFPRGTTMLRLLYLSMLVHNLCLEVNHVMYVGVNHKLSPTNSVAGHLNAFGYRNTFWCNYFSMVLHSPSQSNRVQQRRLMLRSRISNRNNPDYYSKYTGATRAIPGFMSKVPYLYLSLIGKLCGLFLASLASIYFTVSYFIAQVYRILKSIPGGLQRVYKAISVIGLDPRRFVVWFLVVYKFLVNPTSYCVAHAMGCASSMKRKTKSINGSKGNVKSKLNEIRHHNSGGCSLFGIDAISRVSGNRISRVVSFLKTRIGPSSSGVYFDAPLDPNSFESTLPAVNFLYNNGINEIVWPISATGIVYYHCPDNGFSQVFHKWEGTHNWGEYCDNEYNAGVHSAVFVDSGAKLIGSGSNSILSPVDLVLSSIGNMKVGVLTRVSTSLKWIGLDSLAKKVSRFLPASTSETWGSHACEPAEELVVPKVDQGGIINTKQPVSPDVVPFLEMSTNGILTLSTNRNDLCFEEIDRCSKVLYEQRSDNLNVNSVKSKITTAVYREENYGRSMVFVFGSSAPKGSTSDGSRDDINRISEGVGENKDHDYFKSTKREMQEDLNEFEVHPSTTGGQLNSISMLREQVISIMPDGSGTMVNRGSLSSQSSGSSRLSGTRQPVPIADCPGYSPFRLSVTDGSDGFVEKVPGSSGNVPTFKMTPDAGFVEHMVRGAEAKRLSMPFNNFPFNSTMSTSSKAPVCSIADAIDLNDPFYQIDDEIVGDETPSLLHGESDRTSRSNRRISKKVKRVPKPTTGRFRVNDSIHRQLYRLPTFSELRDDPDVREIEIVIDNVQLRTAKTTKNRFRTYRRAGTFGEFYDLFPEKTAAAISNEIGFLLSKGLLCIAINDIGIGHFKEVSVPDSILRTPGGTILNFSDQAQIHNPPLSPPRFLVGGDISNRLSAYAITGEIQNSLSGSFGYSVDAGHVVTNTDSSYDVAKTAILQIVPRIVEGETKLKVPISIETVNGAYPADICFNSVAEVDRARVLLLGKVFYDKISNMVMDANDIDKVNKYNAIVYIEQSIRELWSYHKEELPYSDISCPYVQMHMDLEKLKPVYRSGDPSVVNYYIGSTVIPVRASLFGHSFSVLYVFEEDKEVLERHTRFTVEAMADTLARDLSNALVSSTPKTVREIHERAKTVAISLMASTWGTAIKAPNVSTDLVEMPRAHQGTTRHRDSYVSQTSDNLMYGSGGHHQNSTASIAKAILLNAKNRGPLSLGAKVIECCVRAALMKSKNIDPDISGILAKRTNGE